VWKMESTGSATDLQIVNGTVLHGTLTLEPTSSLNNRVYGSVASTDLLTIATGANVMVLGGSVDLGVAFLTVTNNGNVTADGTTEFRFDPASCVHTGQFAVRNGGLFNLLGNVSGTGGWEADGGRLLIGSNQSVTTTGDVAVINGGELELGNASTFSAGDLMLGDTAIVDVNGTGRILVAKSFINAMTTPASWQWDSGTSMEMSATVADVCDTASYATIEAAGASFKIPKLVIKSGARIRLVDDFDNDAAADPESLRVGTLVLEGSGVIYLNGLEIVADTIQGDFDCQVGDTTFLVQASDPPHHAIDARQPFAPDGTNPAGWDAVDITFCGDVTGLTVADFTTSEDGGNGIAPAIAVVTVLSPDTVRIELDTFIEAKAWTAVTHVASGSCVRLGYMPADVDGDETAAVPDVLRVVDCLNGVYACPDYSVDVDRSGLPGAPDVLRVVDLLNGAGSYDPFLNVSLPDLP